MVQSAFIPRFPSRPFPAKEWLKKRAAASSAATPPPQAAVPTPASAPSDELLDLALLASCLPRRLYSWLIARLEPLAATISHLIRGATEAPRRALPPYLTRARTAWAGCAPGCSLNWRVACLWQRCRSGR